MRTKSPFLIIENFYSPLECENIVSLVDTSTPNMENRKKVKSVYTHGLTTSRVWNRFSEYITDIEDYFNIEIDSASAVDVEIYPANSILEDFHCDNSIYKDGKWKLFNKKDFTCILFLKDHSTDEQFDPLFECYGGQLEIKNHQFSFNPQRGSMVIFPSNQYFIYRTLAPKFGDFLQAKFFITCPERFVYDKNQYAGNYKVWFDSLT